MTEKRQPRVLFICKIRSSFYGPSFGLINSCRFIANALENQGIDCKVVSVVDNNDIDHEVHKFKPTHVFIEALWVVPEKFEELIPLHPKIKWFVRIHSKIPFLANEGMAMQWLREYDELSKVYPQLSIAANSTEIIESFDMAYNIKIGYYPNIYYPPDYDDCEIPPGDECDYGCHGEHSNGHGKGKKHDGHDDDDDNGHHHHHEKNHIDIGCFGAIRPMKNHLNQALASIAFGNKLKKKIQFHINSDRCEMNGDPVLKNLVYAFKDTPHKLILHPWMDHHDFIRLVVKMDVGMQVSLSETFNIVAADFAWNNVAVIGSDEVAWLDRKYKADPHHVEDMVDKLRFAYKGKDHNIQQVNKDNLVKYNKKATKVWLDAL